MSAEEEIKLDLDTDVIIEIRSGTVSDYYLPKGIHIVILDRDELATRDEEEWEPITRAAVKVMEQQRKEESDDNE